ncbi:hypothetical protein E4U54_002323, partial [Claviceps lovelessii]
SLTQLSHAMRFPIRNVSTFGVTRMVRLVGWAAQARNCDPISRECRLGQSMWSLGRHSCDCNIDRLWDYGTTGLWDYEGVRLQSPALKDAYTNTQS